MRWILLLLCSCASAPSGPPPCTPDPLVNGEEAAACVMDEGIRMCAWRLGECGFFLARPACHAEWFEYPSGCDEEQSL